jgi:S-adenosylmethionine synthetase
MMERNIVITKATGQYIDDLPVEIVERKGIGHPDSLCDGMAERISREYSRWCLENLAVQLHHNFDKVQLVAGEVNVHFGGGEVIRPIRVQIAGRGTPSFQGQRVPLDTIAIEAARAHLGETMRYLDPVKHVVIDSYAGRGAAELVSVVDQVTANDTSFGVSHWPRSALENVVYHTANFINYDLINQFPVGEDVKVMGYRTDGEIILTVALPFIATEVKDETEYVEVKNAAQAAIQRYAEAMCSRHQVRVDVNTADQEKRGDYYLTLTGTSAECGDDGAVGRGNRVNGVIAPFRAASLEAACGKNPISHVGKIYNVLALHAARNIVEEVREIKAATVYVLAQIGQPLDHPLVATAQVHSTNGHLTDKTEAKARAILDYQLADVSKVGERVCKGELSLF